MMSLPLLSIYFYYLWVCWASLEGCVVFVFLRYGGHEPFDGSSLSYSLLPDGELSGELSGESSVVYAGSE